MPESLQFQSIEYLSSEPVKPPPHAGRFDPARYAVLGGILSVSAVFGAFIGGVYIANRVSPTPDTPPAKDDRTSAVTEIVMGVQSLVLDHRSTKECQDNSGHPAQIMLCNGVEGFQLDIEQCHADVKNALRGKQSYSFNPSDLVEDSEGCYDEWVSVSERRYEHTDNGKIIQFRGQPDQHLTS